MTSLTEPGLITPPLLLAPLPSGLTCEVITSFARLCQLSADWDRLWSAEPDAEFFQSFAWARAWWSSFGEGRQLFVPVVYQDGEVALILPLVQQQGKLRFLGSPQADYCDVLSSRRNLPRLLSFAFNFALESFPQWTECVLDHLRPNSQIVRAWPELPLDLRRLMRLELADSCPTILLGENRDQVLDPLLAGKHLRRRLNKLQKSGVVTFRHIEKVDEAHDQLTFFFSSHRRRCALLAKTSCFERIEMRELMRSLVNTMDLRRDLRFGVLELNGQALAWSLGFQTHGKYAYYQQTFDVDAEELAPGEVLLRFLLSYAKDSVEREFDFLRGDEFFKKRFATQVSHNRCLYLQRPGIRGRLRRCGRILQGRAVEIETRIQDFVRTRESLFQLFRSLWIFRRTLTRRLQWAKSHGGLTDYLLESLRDSLGGALWNKQVTTRFEKDPNPISAAMPSCLISDPEIQIVAGHLSDLADLALEYPEIPFPGFREYRSRLKNGDRVYLIYRRGRLSLVAWTGVRPVDAPSPNAHTPALDSALAMYECWPIQNPRLGCMQLLTMLAAKTAGHSDLLVCCPAMPEDSKAALKKQGFLPKSRFVQHDLLRWLRHRSVHPCANCDEPHPPDDGSCPKLRKSQSL
jgi:CelD/BcsL family acetyltransferase involved in cellulose biosynthesis